MSERLVVTGGLVFDGTDGELRRGDVAIEDGVIAEVGLGLDGDTSYDADGSVVLPGLFDCHVHLLLHDLDTWQIVQQPISYRFYQAVGHLQATLETGITTVRDAAGADLGLKSAVEQGIIRGPRVQLSLVMLSQTGGHGDYWMPSGVSAGLLPHLPHHPSGVVDGPDEIRKTVRELLRAGADVIKVAATGGVLSPRDDPRHGHFRDHELAVMVEEADAAGVPVMAHALGAAGIKAAVRAGVRSIEHGVYLDDEAVELMLENDAFLVPTLSAGRGVLRSAEAGTSMHEETLRKQLHASQSHARSFALALDAGVRIAMGTDAGVTPHGDNLWELELMVEGGMTHAQALVASTRSAAELLGLSDELGTIEPRKRADLVVVRGTELNVLGLRERISAVFKDGRLAVLRDPPGISA
jgi:imidazolonepropionase-like amidohydrolase